MPARDSTATRARILDAAIAEFTTHGLAGARIDRVAEAAGANKRSIYVYYENKELLFNAALHRVLSDLTAAVPLTEDDLPGYAGRMFDYTLAHPQAIRMSMWRKLERPAAGPNDSEVYAEKIATMATGRTGTTSGLPPTDLIVLIFGIAAAWHICPDDLLSADGSDPTSAERIAVHRAALVEAARRVCAPPEK
jgi:AcrR family transcriptional regulator